MLYFASSSVWSVYGYCATPDKCQYIANVYGNLCQTYSFNVIMSNQPKVCFAMLLSPKPV